jgi:diguanylate cyclase (GGDEF)-like protein
MVTDRPSRGWALGGVSAGVGTVCQTVADHLAAHPGLMPSVWLEHRGRLRCAASTGDWPRHDGITPTEGVVGATFTAGVETVVEAASGAVADGARGGAARACLPIRCDGCVVGVLDVEVMRPLNGDDLERFRDAATTLGHEIARLGGASAETGARRMLRHMTGLSALDEPDAIAAAAVTAALELMGLDSAAFMRCAPRAGSDGASGASEAVVTLGPLGAALARTPLTALVAEHGNTSALVATPADLAHPVLEPLRAAGARTFVAVALVAQAQPFGLLLLAGRTERRVSIDDVELLELLAAHAATCLRTADLMRSLRERAASDPLTGLGHHATFHETLARTHRRPRTAVVLIDVDGFKRLNDTFGHAHGDEVLRAIAAALDSALRRGDTLFRIGGDEFAALLSVSGPDDALEAGMRLRAAVVAADLGVTISIGVAVPQEGEPDSALLARADRALYRVKDAGRDGVAVADAESPPVVSPV